MQNENESDMYVTYEDGVPWMTVEGTFRFNVIADTVEDAVYHAELMLPDLVPPDVRFVAVVRNTCDHQMLDPITGRPSPAYEWGHIFCPKCKKKL